MTDEEVKNLKEDDTLYTNILNEKGSIVECKVSKTENGFIYIKYTIDDNLIENRCDNAYISKYYFLSKKSLLDANITLLEKILQKYKNLRKKLGENK